MIVPIAIVTAFLVTFILMPVVINVTKSVDLMDMPDRRKVHRINTPSMGGIAIYLGWLVAILITIPIFELAQYKFLLSGVLLIYILGFRDDISSLQARHKLSFQILAGILVVYFGGIYLTDLHGFLGISEIDEQWARPLTVFAIVALTNSFNLIDGIDGLAASVTILAGSVLAWMFLEMGQLSLAILSLSLCGAMIAFLFYNWFPSRIFMGDTGSMTTGFFISVLAILAVKGLSVAESISFPSNYISFVLSLLILPIYDTLRVTIIRLSKGISPFVPDRNHIHHAVLRLGYSHAEATSILMAANLVLIGLSIISSFYLSEAGSILIMSSAIVLFGFSVDQLGKRQKFLAISGEIQTESNLTVSKSA